MEASSGGQSEACPPKSRGLVGTARKSAPLPTLASDPSRSKSALGATAHLARGRCAPVSGLALDRMVGVGHGPNAAPNTLSDYGGPPTGADLAGAATLDDSDHSVGRIPRPVMLPSRGLKHAHVFVLSALSARGAAHHRDVPAISFQTMLYDLEAVVDALALERFALLGISAGAATSIAFAVRHPHRVSKLVLFGGYAQGRYKRDSPQDAEDGRAFLTMGRHGWGDDRLLFARAFLSFFLPAGTPEQLKSSSSFSAWRSMGEPP